MPQPKQQQPSPSQNLTWGQKIETAAYWARIPALTLMVFLRRDLGCRILNPLWLIGVAIFMAMLAGLSDPNHRPDDLVIFALIVLTLGFYQRYNRWLDLRRGEKRHTFYIGTSIFQKLRWPEFLRRDRRICRTIDPLACGLIGLLLVQFTRVLGLWIIFASFCLLLFEEVAFRKEFHRDLDTLDGMVNAEVQGETVEHFSPPTDAQAQEASEGIPTGLGDDIKERIKSPQTVTPPPLTKTRIALAFTVAAFADALQIPIHFLESNAIINYLGIPVHFIGIPIDLFAAAVTIILIGFHPALLPSFIVKIMPAVAGLPTWTAAVGYVVWSRKHGSASAPTQSAEPSKPDATKPPTNPKPAPSGLWILVIGATLIVAFIWSRHAPAQRAAASPPVFLSARTATPAPAPELARTPSANGKMIVAVGPLENLSSKTTPFSGGQGFDPRTGLASGRKQLNPNAEAVCSILEDQLSHIDGIEIVGKEQMRALRSQLDETTGAMSENAKNAKLRSLFPANMIVLLAIVDIHDQKQEFNAYGIKSTTVKTTCSLRTQVMNTADGTISYSKILSGSKSESKTDAAATSSTDDPGFEAIKDALQKLDNDGDFKNALRGKTSTTQTTAPDK